MADNTHLSSAQLRDLFEKLAKREKKSFDQKGIADVLRNLSNAVKSMQDAGIDIAVDVRSGQYTNAYDLLFSNIEANNSNITVYGFFHIGGAAQLWALADSINDAPVKKLIVSEFNAAESQGRTEWSNYHKTPGKVFDLDTDTDAMAKLQLHLTSIAAERQVLREYDAADVFGRPAPVSTQGKLPVKKGLVKPSRP